MDTPRIGLLPLYVELYDRALPGLRQKLVPMTDRVCEAFAAHSVAVSRAPVCCFQSEVVSALEQFDRDQVDLIVTLHLAYSPSLESAAPLVASRKPLLLLDTTMDADFSRDVNPERLLYNHGIHGVQDLAALLRRYGKKYEVIAGHLSDPSVMMRAAEAARAAHAAVLLKAMKTLCIGGPLDGMGDFRVEPAVLLSVLGITTDTISPKDLGAQVEMVSNGEIEAEMRRDLECYEGSVDVEVHRRSLRLGLGLRRYLEKGGYGAFSINFDAFRDSDGPVNTVPFLECCKAMARGVGFAGEGDVLTASLVGALSRAYGLTSFVEMFCSDWNGDSIFLAHMGEFNPELSGKKPLLYEKAYTLSQARNPVALGMAPRPGVATYVNISPGPDNTFRLIISPVEVLEDGTHPDMAQWVRAWIRPPMKVATYLEEYSRLGGTHHSALIMGRHCESLKMFARMVGMEACCL
jgi:L-arabinose isomerase